MTTRSSEFTGSTETTSSSKDSLPVLVLGNLRVSVSEFKIVLMWPQTGLPSDTQFPFHFDARQSCPWLVPLGLEQSRFRHGGFVLTFGDLEVHSMSNVEFMKEARYLLMRSPSPLNLSILAPTFLGLPVRVASAALHRVESVLSLRVGAIDTPQGYAYVPLVVRATGPGLDEMGGFAPFVVLLAVNGYCCLTAQLDDIIRKANAYPALNVFHYCALPRKEIQIRELHGLGQPVLMEAGPEKEESGGSKKEKPSGSVNGSSEQSKSSVAKNAPGASVNKMRANGNAAPPPSESLSPVRNPSSTRESAAQSQGSGSRNPAHAVTKQIEQSETNTLVKLLGVTQARRALLRRWGAWWSMADAATTTRSTPKSRKPKGPASSESRSQGLTAPPSSAPSPAGQQKTKRAGPRRPRAAATGKPLKSKIVQPRSSHLLPKVHGSAAYFISWIANPDCFLHSGSFRDDSTEALWQHKLGSLASLTSLSLALATCTLTLHKQEALPMWLMKLRGPLQLATGVGVSPDIQLVKGIRLPPACQQGEERDYQKQVLSSLEGSQLATVNQLVAYSSTSTGLLKVIEHVRQSTRQETEEDIEAAVTDTVEGLLSSLTTRGMMMQNPKVGRRLRDSVFLESLASVRNHVFKGHTEDPTTAEEAKEMKKKLHESYFKNKAQWVKRVHSPLAPTTSQPASKKGSSPGHTKLRKGSGPAKKQKIESAPAFKSGPQAVIDTSLYPYTLPPDPFCKLVGAPPSVTCMEYASSQSHLLECLECHSWWHERCIGKFLGHHVTRVTVVPETFVCPVCLAPKFQGSLAGVSGDNELDPSELDRGLLAFSSLYSYMARSCRNAMKNLSKPAEGSEARGNHVESTTAALKKLPWMHKEANDDLVAAYSRIFQMDGSAFRQKTPTQQALSKPMVTALFSCNMRMREVLRWLFESWKCVALENLSAFPTLPLPSLGDKSVQFAMCEGLSEDLGAASPSLNAGEQEDWAMVGADGEEAKEWMRSAPSTSSSQGSWPPSVAAPAATVENTAAVGSQPEQQQQQQQPPPDGTIKAAGSDATTPSKLQKLSDVALFMKRQRSMEKQSKDITLPRFLTTSQLKMLSDEPYFLSLLRYRTLCERMFRGLPPQEQRFWAQVADYFTMATKVPDGKLSQKSKTTLLRRVPTDWVRTSRGAVGPQAASTTAGHRNPNLDPALASSTASSAPGDLSTTEIQARVGNLNKERWTLSLEAGFTAPSLLASPPLHALLAGAKGFRVSKRSNISSSFSRGPSMNLSALDPKSSLAAVIKRYRLKLRHAGISPTEVEQRVRLLFGIAQGEILGADVSASKAVDAAEPAVADAKALKGIGVTIKQNERPVDSLTDEEFKQFLQQSIEKRSSKVIARRKQLEKWSSWALFEHALTGHQRPSPWPARQHSQEGNSAADEVTQPGAAARPSEQQPDQALPPATSEPDKGQQPPRPSTALQEEGAGSNASFTSAPAVAAPVVTKPASADAPAVTKQAAPPTAVGRASDEHPITAPPSADAAIPSTMEASMSSSPPNTAASTTEAAARSMPTAAPPIPGEVLSAAPAAARAPSAADNATDESRKGPKATAAEAPRKRLRVRLRASEEVLRTRYEVVEAAKGSLGLDLSLPRIPTGVLLGVRAADNEAPEELQEHLAFDANGGLLPGLRVPLDVALRCLPPVEAEVPSAARLSASTAEDASAAHSNGKGARDRRVLSAATKLLQEQLVESYPQAEGAQLPGHSFPTASNSRGWWWESGPPSQPTDTSGDVVHSAKRTRAEENQLGPGSMVPYSPCARPGCGGRARLFSKYCSATCGFQAAQLALFNAVSQVSQAQEEPLRKKESASAQAPAPAPASASSRLETAPHPGSVWPSAQPRCEPSPPLQQSASSLPETGGREKPQHHADAGEHISVPTNVQQPSQDPPVKVEEQGGPPSVQATPPSLPKDQPPHSVNTQRSEHGPSAIAAVSDASIEASAPLKLEHLAEGISTSLGDPQLQGTSERAEEEERKETSEVESSKVSEQPQEERRDTSPPAEVTALPVYVRCPMCGIPSEVKEYAAHVKLCHEREALLLQAVDQQLR